MAKGVNKVILVGHLGADPEVRYSAGGLAFANVSLATNHSVKNKQTGEWQDATEWHRVVFFDRLAEVVGEYLRKGSQIYVEGRLQTRKWQDQQTSQDRWTTEIVANEMQMLGSRFDSGTAPYAAPSAGAGSAGAGSGYASPPPQRTPPAPPYGSPPSQYGSPPPQQAAPPSPPPYDGQQYSPPPPPPPTGTVSPPPAGSNNPPSKGFDDDIPF